VPSCPLGANFELLWVAEKEERKKKKQKKKEEERRKKRILDISQYALSFKAILP
jgi:hypothetical protein